ncbi:MAG: polysaccharide lyase [Jiangellaceae bacterium]
MGEGLRLRRSHRGLAVVVVAWVTAAAPALAQEPGLADRDDIVLQDGFEQADWYTTWGMSDPPQNTSIESDDPFRGESHLRVAVPEGSHYGTSFGFDFADMGMAEPDEVYFRYAIRLGPTWTTEGEGGGGKLPGFGGTYGEAGWGGRPSDGTNGWSARGLFWPPESGADSGATRVGYYAYHADMDTTYGDNWFWSGGPIGPDGVLERGRWYQIETYVRNNTPGENDGVLRAWVDDAMVFERTDVRFRDTMDLHVERVWFDIYYGGSWTAPDDMHLDFDNAVIAWNRIGVADEPDGGTSSGGCGIGGAPPGPAAPWLLAFGLALWLTRRRALR